MKPSLLKFLACPKCKSDFECKIYSKDKEIEEGTLICKKCGREYPIINSVPRILTKASSSKIKKMTAKLFSYEWQSFSKLYELYKEQFLDWIYPIKPSFFKNKVVLDAGCGIGRHVYYSAKFGAKEIIGIDLSDSVYIARENTKDLPNVHIIQADIHNLPLKKEFDFIYSIGVLHHLSEPERGFKKLLKHLKRKGTIFVWVYGKEGNYFLKILIPLRKIVKRLPFWLIKFLSFFISIFLFPIVKIIYKPLNEIVLTKHLAMQLPQNPFFYYLTKFNFTQIISIVFDQLSVPIANYYSKDEFKKWFQNAKLKNIVISWRNKNSWRGSGNS